MRIDAEEWKAISSSGTIPGGARVRVTGIDGFVLTVEPAPQSTCGGRVRPLTVRRREREGGTD